MKLKKLAAKISSLILMALCCSFAKTSALDTLTGALCGSVEKHALGTEIHIDDVNPSYFEKGKKDKKFIRKVSSYISELAHKYVDIFKVTFDGIVYEVNPETKTLYITEFNSPTGEICYGAVEILNIHYEVKEKRTEIRSSFDKPYWVVSGCSSIEPKFIVNKVVMKGNIRKIYEHDNRDYLRSIFSGGYPIIVVDERFKPSDSTESSVTSFEGIPIEEFDLSQITSEKLLIGRNVFSCCKTNKIILPCCPIIAVSTNKSLHSKAEVVNKEFITYKEPNLCSPHPDDEAFEGVCCTIA